ncbi:MAG: hypothetical protein EBS01_12590 [Verrucomicrobia bacterium]|nr:hypothetical protein [Verrucomicrobiota bacterium]
MRSFFLHSGCWFCICLSFALAQPNPAADNLAKPWAGLQVLVGAQPHPVSLAFDARELFPGLQAGTRISNFSLTNRAMMLKIQKTGTPDAKEFALTFDKGKFYTLCVFGDFAPLPPKEDRNGKAKPDFQIEALLLQNTKANGATVDVRAVNASTNRVVELSREGRVVGRVAPGAVETVPNQPANLLMSASDGRASFDLPMAQATSAANITILFYEADGRMAFKAMTERTEAP